MLGRLLKYDLFYVYKLLVVFYGLALFFAVLTRIFFSIDDSFIIYIIAKICSGVTIAMIFNIIINCIIRSWVRFKNNIYGDEAYLTHTLPVTKKEIYLSKMISGMGSIFDSVLVIGLTLFIAYYSKENLEVIKNLLLPVADIYNSSIVKIILVFLFIFFLEMVNLLQVGYTGMILGNTMSNFKLGFSILFGFISYNISQVIVLIVLFITALFNKDIMNLFHTTEIINFDVLKTIIYISIFVYIFIIVLGYFINMKLFNKGVNVD